MKRRSFLAALFAAPSVAVATKQAVCKQEAVHEEIAFTPKATAVETSCLPQIGVIHAGKITSRSICVNLDPAVMMFRS